jgi:hypothetical protein
MPGSLVLTKARPATSLRALLAFAACGLVACAHPADVAEPPDPDHYQSSFGFRAAVPDAWVVLSRQELLDNPELFDGFAELPGLDGVDPGLMTQIQHRIRSGQVEFLFRVSQTPSGFADNINVIKQVGKLPQDHELAQVCRELPAIFAQHFGRPAELHRCDFATVAERPALHLEFDGAVAGTRSIQYSIQRSSAVQLVITATATLNTLAIVQEDLARVLATLEFTSLDGS